MHNSLPAVQDCRGLYAQTFTESYIDVCLPLVFAGCSVLFPWRWPSGKLSAWTSQEEEGQHTHSQLRAGCLLIQLVHIAVDSCASSWHNTVDSCAKSWHFAVDSCAKLWRFTVYSCAKSWCFTVVQSHDVLQWCKVMTFCSKHLCKVVTFYMVVVYRLDSRNSSCQVCNGDYRRLMTL